MSQSPRSASSAHPAARSRRTDGVAVALGYDPGSGRAPTVLASGRGAVADQILAIAFAQGIKVREDADLAEILAAVDVDSEIPLEALAAVAEILSYVYRANGRLRGGAAADSADAADAGAASDPSSPCETRGSEAALAGWRALFGDAPTDPAASRPPSAAAGSEPAPAPGESAHE